MNKSDKAESQVLFGIDLVDYDICLNCPEMDIVNHRTEFFYGIEKTYENHLACSHFERCRHLKERIDTHEKHGL